MRGAGFLIGLIKKAMDGVRADEGLSSDEKRARLDALIVQRNGVLKLVSERMKEAGVKP